MNFLILKTSLSPRSRSDAMANIAYEDMKSRGVNVELLTIKDMNLPLCDSDAAYSTPGVKTLNAAIDKADGVIFAVPIHNYSPAASSKNVIELLDKETFRGKVAGFIVAAGGAGSYMAVMPLANSLILDFRWTIVPRFVYADFKHFEECQSIPEEIQKRIKLLNAEIIDFTQALTPLKNKT